MKKRFIYALIGIIVVVAILAAVKTLQIRRMIEQGKNFVPPPETVTATTAKRASWGSDLTAVGSLTAVQGVTVASELAGKVTRIAFEPGGYVRKGELLVSQDTSSEEAQLQGALAQADLASSKLQRDRKMRAERIISQADYDASVAARDQALAQANNIRATISKKTVRAPFSGRLGIRQVNLGQILKEGDPMVTLQTMEPIYANFALPQQQLSRLRSGQRVRVTSDALPGLTSAGRITAINPIIDSETRNVQVQATLGNRGEKLQPGMFVNVSVGLPDLQQVLVIPATAVLYAPYGDSVFVIVDQQQTKEPGPGTGKQTTAPKQGTAPTAGAKGGTGKVLRQQFVRLGEKRGDLIAVTSGLKESETVVSTGVFKLTNGQSVLIDNTLAPKFQQAPKPENN